MLTPHSTVKSAPPPVDSVNLAIPARRHSWAPETAGEHVVSRVPLAMEVESVQTVLGRIGSQAFDSLEALYVVDSSLRFLGAVRLVDLYRASRGKFVADLVNREYPRVGPRHDQEHVAAIAYRRGASSVAVVDDDGHLLGEVPPLALLTILRHEHVEDLHRLAGIKRERARDRKALEAPPTRRARHRLPWLLVGLVGSMLAALVVSRFERVLESKLAVAYFVPTIVYLADAIGTQTEAIVVRGLSVSRLSLRHVLGGELRTGLLIGTMLAALALPMVSLAFGDVRLGISVSAAILVAGGVATTIGLVLPWLLQKLGSDPAFGSGPIATIIQDVLSLVIYFTIATTVLG
ncbi:MAG: magnesium transporter [Polyangiaceae bacterium]|nr:magnesium transporter [Polyangiaceae bacterium]